jgi:hypothetical protein
MRAADWRTAKSPRCQTSSFGATTSFQRATIAASIAAVVANGRLNSPRAPPWPKWWSPVKNRVISRLPPPSAIPMTLSISQSGGSVLEVHVGSRLKIGD